MSAKFSVILQEDINRYPYMISEEETCAEYLNELLLDVLAVATTATAKEMNMTDKFEAGTPAAQEFITSAIRYGHNLWKDVLVEIQRLHNHNDLSEIAFLIFMETIANPSRVPYDQEAPDRIMPYHIGVETVINEIAGTMTEQNVLCADVMKRINAIKDMNLLHQFFDIFTSMDKVYRDPSRYDDEDDLKKHYQLMSIYNQIMSF